MKKFAEKPDILGLGLSRPWQGALLGIFSVLFISALCGTTGFHSYAVGFLFPGYLVFLQIDPLTGFLPPVLASLLHFFAILLVFGVSGIVPATIGSLIISERLRRRNAGIVLLAIYILLWIFSSFAYHILSD